MALKIKDIDSLRDHVLDVFSKLSEGEIDIHEAGIVAKLSETVISGLKTQMEYARLTDSRPNISFLNVTIDGSVTNTKLLNGS